MPHTLAPMHNHRSQALDGSRHAPEEVAYGVARLRTMMVNVYFVGDADGWVLVDTGMPGYADAIAQAAEARFGPGARPRAIVLTHGHFDHVGAVETLAARWDVPVYAHVLEVPYLSGMSKYPPPEPLVGGGAMAALSFLYPRGPIDLGDRLRLLPDDGPVDVMPGWRVLETPGHSPGHVSFFRDEDRVLIAGDAIVTTKQESALAVMTQRCELRGPPMYFTPDWDAARRSVEVLAALEPLIAATGHGVPMRGPDLAPKLRMLALEFDDVTRPHTGRYADRPAVTNESGVVSVPAPVISKGMIAAAAAVVVLGILLGKRRAAAA